MYLRLRIFSIAVLAISFLSLSSCINEDVPPCEKVISVGDILCTDGSVVTLTEFANSGKIPTAVVYYVNPKPDEEIMGYAVYLTDISDEAFSESLDVFQNTSKDIYALDGNENTYAIFKTKEVISPMALPVFDLWTYGQSAYIPSVEQLRQLQKVHSFLNPRLIALGGKILPDTPDDCWYWSSTEVAGQHLDKAWLVSMNSGIIHETPKDQKHHCRPVVTIYRHNGNNYPFKDIELDSIKSLLTVNFKVEKSLFDYQLIDSIDFNSRESSSYKLRYFLAAYKGDHEEPAFTEISDQPSINLSISPGLYNLVGWSEPVPDNAETTHYFYTDDFSEMLQKHKYNYIGNDSHKTPFRGVLNQNIQFSTRNVDINLVPAFGQFRLVATDSASFNPKHIKITYHQLPSSIHALTGEINGMWSGISYKHEISGEILSFDNVYSADEETYISLKVEIFDENDVIKAAVRNIEVPLINGGITTLKGNFFSMLVGDDYDPDGDYGGVEIDDRWENTYEIEYSRK